MLLNQCVAVLVVGVVVVCTDAPLLLLRLGQLMRRDVVVLHQVVGEKLRELHLTVDVQVVEVVEVGGFVQTRLVVVQLEVDVVKAVLVDDVGDGVAALKTREGASHDDVRKTRKDHVGQVFFLAEGEQLAQSLFLGCAERLSAVGGLLQHGIHRALGRLENRRLVENALEIAVAVELVLHHGFLIEQVVGNILPYAVVLHQREHIFHHVVAAVFGDPLRLGHIERHIVGKVAQVGFLGGFAVVGVECAVELDHDQVGVLAAEDVFQLCLIVQNRIGLGGKQVAGEVEFFVGIAGCEVRIHLARAHKHHVERIFVLQIKALQPLTVVVGMAEDKFLQHACRHR